MNLKDIGRQACETAHEKGWYDNGVPTFGERIALSHSELSEALEAYRTHGFKAWTVTDERGHEKPEGVLSEIADVIIRIAELAHLHATDLDAAVAEKMAYNKTRPYRHGGKKL